MLSEVFSLLACSAFVNAQGFVALPISKVVENEPASSLSRRAVSQHVLNAYTRYIVGFYLGDKQYQRANLDTGSSDLWVYSNKVDADYTYDPSGAQLVNNYFSIEYYDGNSANGSYYKDNMTWGSTSVEVQFGVSNTYSESQDYGVLGIGPPLLESSAQDGHGVYDNYPQALKKAGKIESAAYSLNLNRIEAASGTLLFGAVDTSRYVGKLQLLDGQADDRSAVEFTVGNQTIAGLLDSGSTYTYLPDDLVAEIAASVGAVWNNDRRAYIVQNNPISRTLAFSFSGTKVELPPSELLTPIAEGSKTLQLSILPYSESDGLIVLGDSFLRSAYVVYDLDNNKFAIAQASWSNDPSDYKVITADGIPGAEY